MFILDRGCHLLVLSWHPRHLYVLERIIGLTLHWLFSRIWLTTMNTYRIFRRLMTNTTVPLLSVHSLGLIQDISLRPTNVNGPHLSPAHDLDTYSTNDIILVDFLTTRHCHCSYSYHLFFPLCWMCTYGYPAAKTCSGLV